MRLACYILISMYVADIALRMVCKALTALHCELSDLLRKNDSLVKGFIEHAHRMYF